MTPELWVALFLGSLPTVLALTLAIIARGDARAARLDATAGKVAAAAALAKSTENGVKVDGFLSRMETKIDTAQAETVASRQETADTRVTAAEETAASHAAGIVAGVAQERADVAERLKPVKKE